MHCDDVRDRLDTLWDAALPPEIGAHLAECASCSAYHRDMLMLHDGLGLWKRDEAPAPSVGFAQRVVRQLRSQPPAIADFLELVGRRFVFGTLALVLFAVLAFSIPSTGPLRSLSAADLQGPTQEATLASADPMGGASETPGTAPASSPAPATANEAK
jgi:hypothetical protein